MTLHHSRHLDHIVGQRMTYSTAFGSEGRNGRSGLWIHKAKCCARIRSRTKSRPCYSRTSFWGPRLRPI